MKPFFFGLKDWWSQWTIDVAGEASGSYSCAQIREMLNSGDISAHTWLRHAWTQRFALVGEALYANQMATYEEFEAWFPIPRRASLSPSG